MQNCIRPFIYIIEHPLSTEGEGCTLRGSSTNAIIPSDHLWQQTYMYIHPKDKEGPGTSTTAASLNDECGFLPLHPSDHTQPQLKK
mmetsp:Transcript_19261/g.32315  ORF Transcript_19261/g.32315 Transcript_19261/m.32315 type:complete len:86 (+) Transcript_19261:627-884(+)